MPEQYNGTQPSKSAVDAGVHAAFEQEGLATEEGLDMPGMRERVFATILHGGKVLAKGERAEKATTKGNLVAAIFPKLPGPDTVDSQSDPVLAAAIYKAVAGRVWEQVKSGADGPVQRLVGINMGNGYVLCRTKIGHDRVDAVYITDDITCIRLDFTRPENDSINSKLAMATRNREMLVMRQPHNAAKYVREYGQTVKSALDTTNSQLALAMASVADNKDEDEEGGDEEE